MKKTSSVLVQTKTGKKGRVYYQFLGDLEKEKVQVHVLDDNFQETGEKLLCESRSLKTTGFID